MPNQFLNDRYFERLKVFRQKSRSTIHRFYHCSEKPTKETLVPSYIFNKISIAKAINLLNLYCAMKDILVLIFFGINPDGRFWIASLTVILKKGILSALITTSFWLHCTRYTALAPKSSNYQIYSYIVDISSHNSKEKREVGIQKRSPLI